MIVACGICGANVAEELCDCQRAAQVAAKGGISTRPRVGRSFLLDACMTAVATRGRVDAHSLLEAAAVLKEDPS